MAIKLKRGTTESWALGPELVDFGQSSTKGKDSVIRAEGIELEMYVYTTSANEWWTDSPSGGGQSTSKIPGLPIYVNGKRQPGVGVDDGLVGCMLKIYFEAPSDCTLEYIDGTGTLCKPQFVNHEHVDTGYDQGGGNFPQLFVKWPAEKVGAAEPVPIKIRVSLRENWLCEELEEGQLGLEYTEDGNIKIKAGMPGVSKWDELPYINAPSLAGKDDIYWNYQELEPILAVPAMDAEGYWICADTPYLWEINDMDIRIGNRKLQNISNTIINNEDLCAFAFDSGDTFLIAYTVGDIETGLGFNITVPRRGFYQMWNTGTHIGSTYNTGGTLIYPKQKIPQTQANLKETDPYNPAYVRNKPEGLSALTPSKEDEGKFLQVINGVPTWSNSLGNLDAALDAIIAIQKELIGVTLITFLIAGAEYQAEEGMTWGDLVGSEYDPDNRVVIQPGGFAGFKTGETTIWNIMNENGDLEYESDIIRDGHLYDLD